MKIIFMGSPLFAVPSLKKLINSSHEILAVYTQPPKPAGRGYKEQETKIHQLANEHKILVKTPKNFKEQNAINEFKDFQADLAIVVAYGLILPQAILEQTKYGFINLHPSSLPRHRGAAPLQRTILAGEKNTDICVIKMDAGIDTGDVLIRKNISLAEDVNFSNLHDLTSELGGGMLLEAIDHWSSLQAKSQDSNGSSYAAKITKQEAYLDFVKDDAIMLDRKIRALNPAPGTFMHYKNKILKIKSAKFEFVQHDYSFGEVINRDFAISCQNGIMYPQIVQLEGKKEMHITEFLRGL